MIYEDLPEFDSVLTDLNTFHSLLNRAGNHRQRIKAMIVQLRMSLQAFSNALDKVDNVPQNVPVQNPLPTSPEVPYMSQRPKIVPNR